MFAMQNELNDQKNLTLLASRLLTKLNFLFDFYTLCNKVAYALDSSLNPQRTFFQRLRQTIVYRFAENRFSSFIFQFTSFKFENCLKFSVSSRPLELETKS